MTRRTWAPYAALALACCLVGLLAWLAAPALPRSASEEASAGGADAEDALPQAEQGVVGAGERPAAPADGQGAGAGGGVADPAPTAGGLSARKLEDLAARAEDEAHEVWTVDAGLEEAVSEVLDLYRQDGAARLLAYGYLDLFGNAWGALVAEPGAWVDVVVAQADEGDETTTLRVARLVPQEGETGDGES